jgi:hypothetical protein
VRPSFCLGPAGSSGPVEGVQRLTRKN